MFSRTQVLTRGPCGSRTSILSARPSLAGRHVHVRAAQPEQQATGIVFQPFQEVKSELAAVDKSRGQDESLARVRYHPECEAGINEQINVEYSISYVYHSLHAYFDRDNVALPGFAAFFKAASDEEREHAQKLIDFQNMRGGRVKLATITGPQAEFDNAEKGEALYAMELVLSLEKLNFTKLRQLHALGSKHDDAQMTNYIEGELLEEQAKAVKEAADYVSQLRRVGKGHGVWHFDRELAEKMA